MIRTKFGTMYGRLILVAILVMSVVAGWSAFAADPVQVSGGAGVSLRELVGSDDLVTVILQQGQEKNVRVVDVGPDYVAVESANGTRNAYKFAAIQEIRVQGGKMSGAGKGKKRHIISETEQNILNRALARTREVFETSTDQDVKMAAAALLSANDNAAAHDYLVQLASVNDVATAVRAATFLYLAGDSDHAARAAKAGLDSSNRPLRARAASLAGLAKVSAAQNALLTMLRDRSADASAPAAIALARIGNRESIPTLVDMIQDSNDVKGDAAVTALSTLGGADVEKLMLGLLDKIQNRPRFRVALVLYRLGNSEGERLLEREYLNVPGLAREAAVTLARNGNAAGLNFLRKKLEEPMDETADNFIWKATAAGALVEGGDSWARSHLQDTLRRDNVTIKTATCREIGRIGESSLMTVLQPAFESSEPTVVLAATQAALAIADADFHARLQERAASGLDAS